MSFQKIKNEYRIVNKFFNMIKFLVDINILLLLNEKYILNYLRKYSSG